MVIFHSYVKYPEGIQLIDLSLDATRGESPLQTDAGISLEEVLWVSVQDCASCRGMAWDVVGCRGFEWLRRILKACQGWGCVCASTFFIIFPKIPHFSTFSSFFKNFWIPLPPRCPPVPRSFAMLPWRMPATGGAWNSWCFSRLPCWIVPQSP